MQQTLRRLDGVANVKVDLLDGKVTITPKPEGGFDPASVLKLTYDSGVSVVEMSLTASGHIVKDPVSGLAFEITPKVNYPIVAGVFADKIQAAAASGATVRMRGIIYTKPPGKIKKSKEAPRLKFEVQEVM
ncbi:MAG TPA: hypothetical protein VGU63_13590 [Candidatus Acidoferrales bacterium]|nr:hypothetical protein [Candidatus Acidoferrales bacterium]